MWTNQPDCQSIISEAWNSNKAGFHAYQLVQGIKEVKGNLWERIKNVFGRVEVDIENKMMELQEIRSNIRSHEDVRKAED